MKYYVYVYLDPRHSGTYGYSDCCFLFKPFYVGKGCGDRWQIHLRESNLLLNQNIHKNRLIRKLKESYNMRDYVVRLWCESEEHALSLEIRLIEEIGFQNLTNLTAGGIGISGFKHSDEFKEFIKINNTKPKPDGFGAKVSATKKGVPLTVEHRLALSKVVKSDEHRHNMSKAARRRWGVDIEESDN